MALKPGFRSGRSGIYPRIALVVLGFAVAALAWLIGLETLNRDYRRSQEALARESVQNAKHAIEILLSDHNRMTRLFAEKSLDTIRALVADPENDDLADQLRAEAAGYFPDFFELTIADKTGRILLTDFAGFVGEVCQRQIQQFTLRGHLDDIFIHPNPFVYHYDIMTHWQGLDGEDGVFFISFKPDDIARILEQTQAPGHRLLLIHNQNGLIEVSPSGARNRLTREARLSESEQAALMSTATVAQTLWTLVDLPEPTLLSEYRDSIIRDSIPPAAVVFLVLLAAIITIVRVEKSRLRAEQALAHLNQQLEKRVEERTRELDRANHHLRIEMEEKNHAEKALESSEKRYALAVEGSNEGIWEWEFAGGSCYFSERWRQMLKLDSNRRLTIQDWIGLVHGTDRPLLESVLEGARNGSAGNINCEYRVDVGKNEIRWFELHGAVEFGANGQPVRLAGSQGDITERKIAEGELERRALFDTLTELPNRALFMERLENSLNMLRRDHAQKFAVLFLDLDEFKSVNDRLGHLAGDELLRRVADRLSERLRPSDTVARFSGDEFIVLLQPLAERGEAIALAQRILDALAPVFELDQEPVNISASIGIAIGNQTYQDPNEIVRDADIAMYHAKESGRNGYFIFNESIRVDRLDKLEIAASLRSAIEENQFSVKYQPMYRLEDGSIYGFEALMRWRHPRMGWVRPEQFIKGAEHSGLIIPMGKWMVRQALNDLRRWRSESELASDVVVSVNLSCSQFLEPDFLDGMRVCFEETGMAGGSMALSFEITETVIMQKPSVAAEVLRKLKSLGISLAVDNFGAGYSSLAYLQNFPIDTLKIDKQFVSQIGNAERNRAIIESVVLMAKRLNLTIIAEGVETVEQYSMLRDAGCDYAQGFYFSQPVEPEQVVRLLDQSKFNSPSAESM